MDTKKEFIYLLGVVKKHLQQQGLPSRNEDIAKTLGYNRTYLSNLIGKKGQVSPDHVKTLKLHFPHLSEKQTSPQGHKAAAGLPAKSMVPAEVTTELLSRLIESNAKQADSHKTLSEANLILAENNRNLIEKMPGTTASGEVKIPPTMRESFSHILVVLAKIQAKVEGRTESEVLRELNKLVP